MSFQLKTILGIALIEVLTLSMIFESDVSLVRVELGFSTTKIEAAISTARNRTLLIAAVELLFAAILSFFFGIYLSRPLKRFQDAPQGE